MTGAMDSAPCEKWAKRAGTPKNDGRRGTLKRICKDTRRVAAAVQEAYPSDMLGGPGADFLKGLPFGASDLQVCEDNFAWQA